VGNGAVHDDPINRQRLISSFRFGAHGQPDSSSLI
jgi:hypothetical protein